KDEEFFDRAKELRLHHAKLTAFGSTRFAKNPVEQDRNVRKLLEAKTPVVSIFGKSWELHTRRALGVTEEKNLKLITDTIAYLKAHGKEVVYDAEHFFDGYTDQPDFALRTLEAAQKAGADVLCLCDTNGGTIPARLEEICAEVRKRFDGVLGIHTHNDSDVAVANALAAIEQGFTHVQGCMNGYGERCGNANLCSIIANLELKLGHTAIGAEKLTGLTTVARFIAELANLQMRRDQPYVGQSAFAHKGGMHFFEVEGYEVSTRVVASGSRSTASVNLKAKDGIHTATATGHGPVHALDVCLRKCLSALYPRISEVRLTDYKVRVLDSKKGTAAKVRVLVEWSDHRKSWSTVGVSDNVIEASWNALVDAIRLELMRLTEQDDSVERAVEDYCW